MNATLDEMKKELNDLSAEAEQAYVKYETAWKAAERAAENGRHVMAWERANGADNKSNVNGLRHASAQTRNEHKARQMLDAYYRLKDRIGVLKWNIGTEELKTH